jgi:hypothetical protein
VLLYLRVEVLDAGRFADRVAASAQADPVADRIATLVTTDVVERAEPDAIVARPVIEGVVAGVVRSDSMRPLVRGAARETYEALVSGQGGDIVLGLSDAAVIAIATLRRAEPDIAEAIPPEAERAAIELGRQEISVGFMERAGTVRVLGLVVPGVAALLIAAGVAASSQRRRAAGLAALAVAAAGGLVAVAVPLGRAALEARTPEPSRAAAGAIWDAFADDLLGWATVMLLGGLAVSLAARGRLDADALAAATRRVLDWGTRPPAGGRDAALRGGTLVLAGLVVALAWRDLLRIAAFATAALIAVQGLELILHALAPRPPPEDRAAESRGDLLRRWRTPLAAGAAGLAAVAVGLGAWGVLRGGPAHGPERVTACNGSPELCERRAHEVVFPATHNSMSAASEPGWFLAGQEVGIADQLEAGIRGLLIDTWYGHEGPRGVATDFARSGLDRDALVRAYGAEQVAAVERLRGRLGFAQPTGEPGLYLCHIACEIGATPLEDALRDIRAFLERNPGEVIVLVLQDQISPDDTRRAFLRSGLRDLVADRPSGGRWPTLGRMIDTGQRVVVMSENRADPGIPWLLPAFEVMEETPYDVRAAAGLDCRANRGPAGAPFFQLNHWIAAGVPSPGDAARVNRREVIVERARRCERERGQLPNLIAVDFAGRGDVVGAARALNGADDAR